MPTLAEAIELYIRAKDQNRPHLIEAAFAETSTIEMEFEAGMIALPQRLEGLAEIRDVISRHFATTYENIYTFCLVPRPTAASDRLSCRWLVGMCERDGGLVRVGTGSYDWNMRGDRIGALTIRIDVMARIEAERTREIMEWLDRIAYPWCTATEALRSAPNVAGLGAVLERLLSPVVRS